MPHDPDLTRTSPPADIDATRAPDPSSTVTGDAAAALRGLATTTGETAGAVVSSPATPVVDAPPGFVVERELGVGGMGVVYLARQTGLNRPVALKVVKGGTAVDAKALIRFLAEAEAVASIKHPNVVEVYQYGEHAGKPYMALEFCPGGDLTTLSKGEQTRDAAWFRKVADLMAGVADGVNAAHAQGIVHRDLKPHNVFQAADGTPKVADFGLAKRGLGSDLTNTEAVMGTPAYMAPEQAGGRTKFVGPEADVWALGVMLYELACGERPIDTTGPLLDAIARVARGEVSPLRTKAPAVPPDLALIAHKCLSKDPRDRYPTAGGLAADLRNWLDGKPISARPAGVVEQAVKWAKRNKTLAGMGAAVLLTMALATGVSLGFGLEANTQAGIARREKTKADDLAIDLSATNADLTQATGQMELALAKAYLGPVAGARGSMSEPERTAVWGLSEARKLTIGKLFLVEAVRTEASCAQLRCRGPVLFHCVSGLSRQRQDETDEFLAERVSDRSSPIELRRTLALAAVESDQFGPSDALADTLLEGMKSAQTSGTRADCAGALAVLAGRLPTERAESVCTRAIDLLLADLGQKGGSDRSLLAAQVGALAERLPPSERVTAIFAVLRHLRDPDETWVLGRGLAAIVDRIPVDDAEQAVAILLRAIQRDPSDRVSAYTTGLARLINRVPPARGETILADALSLLAADTDRRALLQAVPAKFAADALLARIVAGTKSISSGRSHELPILADGLRAVAERLPADQASAKVRTAAEAVAADLLQWKDRLREPGVLMRTLAPLASGLPGDQVEKVLTAVAHDGTMVVILLGNPSFNDSTPQPSRDVEVWAGMATGVRALCRTASAERSADLYDRLSPPLLKALDREVPLECDVMTKAGMILIALTELLPAEQAEKECLKVAATLARAVAKSRNAYSLATLVAGIGAVAERVGGESPGLTAALAAVPDKQCRAAALSAVNLFSRAGRDTADRLLADGVRVLANRLPPEEAAGVAASALCDAARPADRKRVATLAPPKVIAANLAAALEKGQNDSQVGAVTAGLAVVAETLPAADSVAVLSAASGRVRGVRERRPLLVQLAVASGRLPAPKDTEARGAAADLLVAELGDALAWEDREAVRELSAGLAAATTGSRPGLRTDPSAKEPATPRPLAPQRLVDLLKHPFCVKEARRVVLDALEFTYDRRFADLWEFVAFAEKEHPELDLLTPPKRPEKK